MGEPRRPVRIAELLPLPAFCARRDVLRPVSPATRPGGALTRPVARAATSHSCGRTATTSSYSTPKARWSRRSSASSRRRWRGTRASSSTLWTASRARAPAAPPTSCASTTGAVPPAAGLPSPPAHAVRPAVQGPGQNHAVPHLQAPGPVPDPQLLPAAAVPRPAPPPAVRRPLPQRADRARQALRVEHRRRRCVGRWAAGPLAVLDLPHPTACSLQGTRRTRRRRRC